MDFGKRRTPCGGEGVGEQTAGSRVILLACGVRCYRGPHALLGDDRESGAAATAAA